MPTKIEKLELEDLHMTEDQLEERLQRLAASGVIGHVNQTRPVLEISTGQAGMNKLIETAQQQGEQPTEAAPEPSEKKSRLSVAKLLARYQERTEAIVSQIETVKKSVVVQQSLIADLERSLTFWSEAISEIEKD